MPETPYETARRRSQERESFTGEGAKKIMREQESALRQGYIRAPEPAPVVRQIGPPPERQVETGLATGEISSAEKEKRRREKARTGQVLTQEDL